MAEVERECGLRIGAAPRCDAGGGAADRTRTIRANRELHARAALTDLPAGLALRELDPWLAAWGELRGRALAAALRVVLRERFDEDWWRNPRSLAALQGLWSRGGRPTAAELWAEIPAAPSLEALSRELAHACE